MVNYSDKPQLAEKLNETNDCFVRALAVSANISYNEAHGIAEELFNRSPQKGTKFVDHIIRSEKGRNYFQDRNIELKAIPHTYVRPRDKRVYPLNIRGFINSFKKGTYLITVNKHALAIVDGVIHDWSNKVKQNNWGNLGRTIKSVYCVENNRQLALFA